MTALHHFEYEEANEAFRAAQQIDPGFVMAYWGEAMTYYQTLWRRENVDAARQALNRLGPTHASRVAKAKSRKEEALLGAVESLFGNGAAPARRRQYADAMARLYARYPDDPEITSLYALALLGNVSRSLIGFADLHDGHDQGLAGSEIQGQVAGLLEHVLRSNPEHPGALHYLLHDYDDPDHAQSALPAARAYARIAGGFSHALHMPAHIFLQLGLWHDAAASDRAAYDASTETEQVRHKGLDPATRNYHALAWLQYELLQLGRYREGWKLIDEFNPIVEANGPLPLLSDRSSMRARYVIETRRWDVMANERNFRNVDELFAIGVSAARIGNRTLAEMARAALAERGQAEQEGDLRPAIAIMEREVAALMELAAARRDAALQILQAAARAELHLPPPLGVPEPVKPAPELLGEVLLEAARPREAIDYFTQALKRNRNRSLSVIGLARAAAAVGDADAARRHYGELLTNFDQADADLPELGEARAAIASPNSTASRPHRITLPIVLVAGGTAAGIVVIRRRRGRRAEAPPAARRKRREPNRSATKDTSLR